MPTCPNCGSIVMEGDPYCSHCGAHFKWNHADDTDDTPQETCTSQSPYGMPQQSYDDDFVPGSYDEPDDFLDYGEVSETYFKAGEETLEYIADHVCATSPQKLQLKAKIRQYMKARDFNGFYIRKEFRTTTVPTMHSMTSTAGTVMRGCLKIFALKGSSKTSAMSLTDAREDMKHILKTRFQTLR